MKRLSFCEVFYHSTALMFEYLPYTFMVGLSRKSDKNPSKLIKTLISTANAYNRYCR